MVSVYPARRRTSPLGVVPVGLGDSVGACHDVANLPRECLFISLLFLVLGKIDALFHGYGLLFLCTAEYASSKAGAQPMQP